MADEATMKNVLAIKQHSETTRGMFRDLEVKLNTFDTLLSKITALETQVRAMQVKLYSGGATS